MSSKKDFVEHMRSMITVEEWVLAPAHPDPGRNSLLLDRGWYYTSMREGGYEEYVEYEEYKGEDGFPGYCAEAVVLRDVAPEFSETPGEFEEACRSAYTIYDYSPGPGLVWKDASDFESDLRRYMEAK